MAIRIANAPCSWGALEFDGLSSERIGYSQMLDELRDTGYIGSELGDLGYMPTTPDDLSAVLQQRNLAMPGAFVPVALKYSQLHRPGIAQALQIAHLLAEVATIQKAAQLPYIILADDNGTDAIRTRNAGRITPEMGLTSAEWRVFTQGAEELARVVRNETGLPSLFHHHCAGYVETPQEIAHFLDMTSSDLLGLVFDTGHYLYGTGGSDGSMVVDGLKRFGERVRHVHFKDCNPRIAQQARVEHWDYFTALRHSVFCELGQGNVPFAAIVMQLQQRNYQGWIVVEQDVLPGMGSPKESAQRNRDYLKTLGL